MTLSTNIYILGKIDGPDLHSWVNKNLLKVTDPKVTSFAAGEQYFYGWDKDQTMPQMAHNHGLHNVLGQGFDAIFELDWWDEPTTYDSWVTSDEDEDDEDVKYAREKQEQIGSSYWAQINFDTAYGFNRDGMGCTELHASYIVRLYREYFEPRGIEIVWQDEYRGTLHRNLSEDGMREFLGAGDKAMDWFFNQVSPIIQAEVAAEGGTIEWS
jgi:hypothetical protein